MKEVLVRRRKDFPRGWEFVCLLCRKVHRHGEGLGHRGSHCQDGGDYCLVYANNCPSCGRAYIHRVDVEQCKNCGVMIKEEELL